MTPRLCGLHSSQHLLLYFSIAHSARKSERRGHDISLFSEQVQPSASDGKGLLECGSVGQPTIVSRSFDHPFLSEVNVEASERTTLGPTTVG
jgi:hypothetical protein